MKALWNGRILAALALMVAISSVCVMCKSETTYKLPTICGASVGSLIECLPSVKPPNPRPPAPGCCTAVASADYTCLCKYKDNPILKVMGIDLNLGYTLPIKCGIEGAPSHC